MTRREEWYHFWPYRPTGTLRVDFRKKSVPQVIFVDVFVFTLSVDFDIDVIFFKSISNMENY